MEVNEKKSISYYMRALHRDIGFLAIGMTLIFGLSGIVLIYRDTGFLKSEKTIERQLQPNMDDQAVGNALHMRHFKIEKTDGDVVYFGNGSYNRLTGLATYTDNALPSFIDRLNNLHKVSSGGAMHYFTFLYALSLIFLAVSSFWMFKSGSPKFKRGLVFTGVGLGIAVLILVVF